MRGITPLLITLLIHSPILAQTGTVRVGGSDLLSDQVKVALQESLRAEGLGAQVTFEGSLAGWTEVASGDLECAIVAYRNTLPIESELENFAVAFQVAKLAVHRSNPLESIGYDALIGLFSESGTLANWGSLVTDPTWTNRQVRLGAMRSLDSMALEIFNAEVIKGDGLKRGIFYADNVENLINQFVQNQAALILLPAVEEGSNFRFLSVRSAADSPAYSPGPDNVLFGDYTLRLPFHIVLGRDLEGEQRAAILRAIVSDRVMDAFVAAHFMPIPETERNALLGVAD